MTRSARYLAVLLALSTFLVAACAHNEGSRAPAHANNEDDSFAQILESKYGITVDGDTASDIANIACDSPTQGVGLYDAQQELAQRHPEINRTNPNAVGLAMSAAVLAYCPDRLP
ncbi:DUF732 domain-containing protein [Mycobacterium sp. 2YAF39]|uniref:DUF732 domain-containing protein n=1 Tax=Mycobacterium sp. 2YAF39 TaxID=3233033 RepID=UPI003F9988F6